MVCVCGCVYVALPESDNTFNAFHFLAFTHQFEHLILFLSLADLQKEEREKKRFIAEFRSNEA